MVEEQDAVRLRRIRMRSWRRGTKEMDLILGPFADQRLEALTPGDLDRLEALLEENDQDLYRWVSGAVECPPRHGKILGEIRRFLSF
jgi:antitoxin CptB